MNTRWYGSKYVLVSPSGILDGRQETELLKYELTKLFESNAACVILNLANVPHLNSQGLRALAECVSDARRHKKRLVVIGAETRIQNIFVIQRLQALFTTLYTSVGEIIRECEWNPAEKKQ